MRFFHWKASKTVISNPHLFPFLRANAENQNTKYFSASYLLAALGSGLWAPISTAVILVSISFYIGHFSSPLFAANWMRSFYE
jgi:hypothetical protein